eukprot:569189-Pelagomonas_calceolata.AAC.2
MCNLHESAGANSSCSGLILQATCSDHKPALALAVQCYACALLSADESTPKTAAFLLSSNNFLHTNCPSILLDQKESLSINNVNIHFVYPHKSAPQKVTIP